MDTNFPTLRNEPQKAPQFLSTDDLLDLLLLAGDQTGDEAEQLQPEQPRHEPQ